jgi:hypothetical protein
VLNRGAVFVAVAAATLCALALGTRTLTSLDLGYHLAYGEEALTTGHLVDHNPYLYTLPSQDLPASQRPTPGPGNWYDQQGRYRFPNANWLSQIAMAAAYRWEGARGLGGMATALVLGIAVLGLWTSRRLELPWTVAAAGLLGLGLVASSRLNLRPELFGYLALAAEVAVLAPIVVAPKRAEQLRASSIVALTALHGLFVNLHSYWMLGLLIAGAVFADTCLRGGPQARRNAGMLLAAMVAVSFANPWTWRLALLPLQTLAYLQEHQIGGGPGTHPWSYILEFAPTVHAGFPDRPSDFAIAALLLLGGAGSLATIARRRWALLIVLVTMSLVALSMRRNVAAAALAVIPLGSAALHPVASRLAGRLTPSQRALAGSAGALAVILGAAIFTHSIVTNRFYIAEGRSMRFGTGIGATHLPVGAARWLDAHLPDARVWCNMGNSSTLHFFTQPHREVPILSNTWAYPPSVMSEQRALRGLQAPVARLSEDYGADAVVINYETSGPLFRALVGNPSWELVHVEGRNVVFAWMTGDHAAVVQRLALSAIADVDDIDAYVARQRELDPTVASALMHPGVVYLKAGLGELAVATFTVVVRERPKWSRAWNYLALAHLTRASAGGTAEERALDREKARSAFVRALALEPGNEVARKHLERLERRRGGEPGSGSISGALEDEE